MDLNIQIFYNDIPPFIHGEFSGITLAYKAKSVEEIDDVLKKAKLAGAVIQKEPEKMTKADMAGNLLTLMATIGK